MHLKYWHGSGFSPLSHHTTTKILLSHPNPRRMTPASSHSWWKKLAFIFNIPQESHDPHNSQFKPLMYILHENLHLMLLNNPKHDTQFMHNTHKICMQPWLCVLLVAYIDKLSINHQQFLNRHLLLFVLFFAHSKPHEVCDQCWHYFNIVQCHVVQYWVTRSCWCPP